MNKKAFSLAAGLLVMAATGRATDNHGNRMAAVEDETTTISCSAEATSPIRALFVLVPPPAAYYP